MPPGSAAASIRVAGFTSAPIIVYHAVVRAGNCSNDRCHPFSSRKLGRKIGEDEVGHGPARLDRCARPMRLQHNIVHVTKRLRNVRLVRKYVEECPAQTPFGKRGNQRGLVDDAAARDIDQDAGGAERVQHRPADEATRRRTAARSDHQKIRFLGQLDGSNNPILWDVLGANLVNGGCLGQRWLWSD